MSIETSADRTYGNWRRPRPPGLWHLGLISSVLLIAGVIAVIGVIALVGLLPGLLLLAVLLPFFLLTLKPDMDGRHPCNASGSEPDGAVLARDARTCIARARWAHAAGHLPAARAAGRLHAEKPTTATTGRSRCCASPWANHYTVVLACEPDGAALVDQEQIDSGLRGGDSGSRRSAMSPAWSPPVTVETAPDPGRGCATRHQPHRPAGSPLGDPQRGRRQLPRRSATIKARVALTFSGIGRGRARTSARWPTSSARGCRS